MGSTFTQSAPACSASSTSSCRSRRLPPAEAIRDLARAVLRVAGRGDVPDDWLAFR